MYKRILLLTVLSTAYALHGEANDETVTTITQRFRTAVTEQNTAEAIIQLQSLKAQKVTETELYTLAIQLDKPQDNKALGNVLDCFTARSHNWSKLRTASDWKTLRIELQEQLLQEQARLREEAALQKTKSDREEKLNRLKIDFNLAVEHASTMDEQQLIKRLRDSHGYTFQIDKEQAELLTQQATFITFFKDLITENKQTILWGIRQTLPQNLMDCADTLLITPLPTDQTNQAESSSAAARSNQSQEEIDLARALEASRNELQPQPNPTLMPNNDPIAAQEADDQLAVAIALSLQSAASQAPHNGPITAPAQEENQEQLDAITQQQPDLNPVPTFFQRYRMPLLCSIGTTLVVGAAMCTWLKWFRK